MFRSAVRLYQAAFTLYSGCIEVAFRLRLDARGGGAVNSAVRCHASVPGSASCLAPPLDFGQPFRGMPTAKRRGVSTDPRAASERPG